MKNDVRVVGTFQYQDGKFISVDQNRRTFDAHKPVPIPASQIEIYYPLKSNSIVTIGNPMNQLTLKSGEIYPTPKGKRIIIEATKERVIFVEAASSRSAPGFFIQTPNGFHMEWLDVIRQGAASKTAAAVVLAEWEVQFLVGVLAGVSWKGLAVVIGVDILEEAVTQKKTKATKEAVRVLQILPKYRKELKEVAPTLSAVISDFMWLTLLKGQKQFLASEMASDPKVAARAAGTIVAQLGKNALDQRLTVSSFIWIMLSQVGVKGALTVPAALSKTIDQLSSTDPKSIVANMESALKTVEIVLAPAEKAEILREIEANPVKITRLFSEMVEEIKSSP